MTSAGSDSDDDGLHVTWVETPTKERKPSERDSGESKRLVFAEPEEAEVESGDDVLAEIAKIKTEQAVIDEFEGTVYSDSITAILFNDRLLRKKAARLVSQGFIKQASETRAELLLLHQEMSMLLGRLREIAPRAEYKASNPFSSSQQQQQQQAPATRYRRLLRRNSKDPGPFENFATRWPAFMEMVASAKRDAAAAIAGMDLTP